VEGEKGELHFDGLMVVVLVVDGERFWCCGFWAERELEEYGCRAWVSCRDDPVF
jgi:hypothetical protein